MTMLNWLRKLLGTEMMCQACGRSYCRVVWLEGDAHDCNAY